MSGADLAGYRLFFIAVFRHDKAVSFSADAGDSCVARVKEGAENTGIAVAIPATLLYCSVACLGNRPPFQSAVGVSSWGQQSGQTLKCCTQG